MKKEEMEMRAQLERAFDAGQDLGLAKATANFVVFLRILISDIEDQGDTEKEILNILKAAVKGYSKTEADCRKHSCEAEKTVAGHSDQKKQEDEKMQDGAVKIEAKSEIMDRDSVILAMGINQGTALTLTAALNMLDEISEGLPADHELQKLIEQAQNDGRRSIAGCLQEMRKTGALLDDQAAGPVN